MLKLQNQLGRRNLTDEQRTYIQGKLYEMMKKAPKGFQDRNLSEGKFFPREEKDHATAKRIGSLFGSSERKVRYAYEFARAVDKVKEINPEAAKKILEGKVKDALTALRRSFLAFFGAASNWLRHVRKELKEELRRKIIDLYLQCYTHEEIANQLGLSRGRITQIVNNFKSEIINNPPVPESLQFYNVWNFQARVMQNFKSEILKQPSLNSEPHIHSFSNFS
ncbi:hypothetical protein J7K27_00635 [Candidatus Bathyarchaeota archaeon]|nr:hypothetical protein [Candidatus Bathyarchaeota archaeon]